MGSGLTRYRSAPSSYFSSFLDNTNNKDGIFGQDDFEQLLNPRAFSPETQRIFARFMSSGDAIQENTTQNTTFPSQSQLNPRVLPPRKDKKRQRQRHDYSPVSQTMYQSHNKSEAENSAMGSNFGRELGSINLNRGAQVKVEGHSLVRHSSSPAGLFDSINIENANPTEFGAMRDIGNFGAGNIANAEASFSSASRFKSEMIFPSSSGMIDSISGFGAKGIAENKPSDGQLDEDRGIPGFPWDDSTFLSDDFLKGLAEDDKTLSAVENMLQDSVPCKIRAKRGFATHPRSIAERVRRTKISERIRKLQELVPNMDKQTNTSDMLDFAVDYIKDLQRQLKKLSDNRAKCSCSNKRET
ncbi:hypothetical protein DH2020_027851 [Rehmannia glutinosa]|uniref:BHLH domain-containing protein n=1 Tax=Rehmannia glutinosa TaxID=99300 RepID=A0ABR0VSZ5_REHGL